MVLKVLTTEKKNKRSNGGSAKSENGPNVAVQAELLPRSSMRNTNRTQGSRKSSQLPQQQAQFPKVSSAKLQTVPLSSSVLRTTDDQSQRVAASQDPCDNSNDSGLGFEERQQQLNKAWNATASEEDKNKRRKMEIKLESEDANFAFPEIIQSDGKIATRNGILNRPSSNGTTNGSVARLAGVSRPRSSLGAVNKRAPIHQGPITLTSQLCNISRNGKAQLQIICQPEQQHRARYQTEGSRGAVKDRSGNGFPIVRLLGYEKPTTLQVFIGTDVGRVAPHMFYQACKVSGKNSTPCVEGRIDGTIVIEVEMDPAKEMVVTCDCVGILKERNVDVEHRFPHEAGVLQGRSKKKSTRCRMVFRTTISNDDGTSEVLQVCSHPIVCTQPPGVPEICKKSLTSCPCTGNMELFIIGKNFLKDTRVVFQLDSESLANNIEPHWECTVSPDKEFLQQNHLICVVPPYRRQDLNPTETVAVKLFVISSGKTSEPHLFLYTAATISPEPSVGKNDNSVPLTSNMNETVLTAKLPIAPSVSGNVILSQTASNTNNFLNTVQSTPSNQSSPPSEVLKNDVPTSPSTCGSNSNSVMIWNSQSSACSSQGTDVMMPPPNIVNNPILNRRPSLGLQMILPDNLKTEVLEENSESSLMSDSSLPGMSNGSLPVTQVSNNLEQLVTENSRDSPQNNIVTAVTDNTSPVQDLLGVVDLMRGPHPLSLVAGQSPFTGLHNSPQVKVLSPHHINKDATPVINSEGGTSTVSHSSGVVDLRMKQAEFNGIGNGNLGSFAATPPNQPLPSQSGQSVEKYLNEIESTPSSSSKKQDIEGSSFGRTTIISVNQQQNSSILATVPASVGPLDELVNSAVDQHQTMVSPLGNGANTSGEVMGHVNAVADHSKITSHQSNRISPPIPKNMLLEALLPTSGVSPMMDTSNNAVASVPVIQEPSPETILTSINAALMPTIQEPAIVAAGCATSTTSAVSVSPHNTIQVPSDVISDNMQIQALVQQEAVMQQQAHQVEQVVAQAQQQVEQVVAHAQQQAVQAVQNAQQQVVQQVVQHAQVVQQAVQKVQAVQQAPTAPAVQQAVQQATQEVVQQAVQQATQEVVQQVQAVQQAVQQAQAAQAMQQAVQQDIGSMLNQPAGFVAEASSALASGAAKEPSQQRLTNAAEQAISSVITNATQDIINNRPITTTTAHAILATKNILNSVATQSAQLMNSAMEGILPKSPGNQNIVEQVTNKSPSSVGPISNDQVSTSQCTRKSDNSNRMMTQELMTDEILSYIDPCCFDPQNGFLM